LQAYGPFIVTENFETFSDHQFADPEMTPICAPDEKLIDMIFVSMPYAAVERPSLALGTLSAALTAAGVTAKTIHGNLMFAERIGSGYYEMYNSSDITSQMGEWTFSEAAFGSFNSVDDYIDLLVSGGMPAEGLKEALLLARKLASQFIDELARDIVKQRPNIVGCSSVFQQHCASLALLRHIRRLDPSIITMMGGANCEGSMGAATHRNYDWVDFVVSGEADHLLPELCKNIIEHGVNIPADSLPRGVFSPLSRQASSNSQGKNVPRAMITQLDKLPIPDFDDYFEQIDNSPLGQHILPGLPIETSRGCWWGAKHHCKFCGLNGAGMAFRSKSESRVIDEINWLTDRYNLNKLMTVDNILDMKYFREVMPELAKSGDKLVFYEIKANLSRKQVETLSKAGVRWIQPGIEALHDGLLKLLDKGCSAAINVQLLKWAYNNGIWVMWNHLFGAPGDSAEWYEEVADLIPSIVHLQPPVGGSLTPIRYDRFSPYFNEAEKFGLDLVPYDGYQHVYPVSPEQLYKQAYFFRDNNPPRPVSNRLVNHMLGWADQFYAKRDHVGVLPQRGSTAPILAMKDLGSHIEIDDTRECTKSDHHILTPLESEICRLCDSARSQTSILKQLPDVKASDVLAACNNLMDLRIIADLGGRILCLAADANPTPYEQFHNFAGGLFMFLGQRKKPQYTDPWEMPIDEIF